MSYGLLLGSLWKDQHTQKWVTRSCWNARAICIQSAGLLRNDCVSTLIYTVGLTASVLLLHHLLTQSSMLHFAISPHSVSNTVLPAGSQHDPMSYLDSGWSTDNDISTNTNSPIPFCYVRDFPPIEYDDTFNDTRSTYSSLPKHRWMLLDGPHTAATTVPKKHCGATWQAAMPLPTDPPWISHVLSECDKHF